LAFRKFQAAVRPVEEEKLSDLEVLFTYGDEKIVLLIEMSMFGESRDLQV